MITLCLIFLALVIFTVLVLALAGILAVAWPVVVILGIGLLIDILVFKLIFRKKEEKK